MATDRFAALARELSARDREVADSLALAREAAQRLRDRAEDNVSQFRRIVNEQGCSHLAAIEVRPVEADEKHVDCFQFKVARGRWEIVCVARAKAAIRLVGPYRRGEPEKPCTDHALQGREVERALDDLLLALIRQASDR